MSTRTMHTTIIASDMPLWALKAFEAIDYDAMNFLTREVLMTGLRSWCSQQPQRQSNYPAEERRTPIPKELAYVLNLVDFSRMRPEATSQAKAFLENQLFTMAPRWGK